MSAHRESTTNWQDTLRKRVVVTSVLLGLWAVGIEARLTYLQVVDHAHLAALASRQQMRTIDAAAKRGDILDRRGRVLATSADADSVYAVPSEIGDPKGAAEKLCRALGDCRGRDRAALAERLGQTRPFTYVRRQIPPEQAKRIAELNLDGIGFLKESRRFYPNKELGAALIGYVGVDNTGLSGIESTYDTQIRGKKGTILIQTDARRHAFSRFERPPTTGSTIELTIDEYLQHVAERELAAGVAESRAAGGTAIIMNPRTGEVLAMATVPTFNPNAYRDFDDAHRRNRAVQDVYEPGSTFKIVTASAAIEEKVMPIDSYIDTSPGVIHISGRPKPVTEASHHNYGVLSFTDVIVRSSNIGAIKIGLRVGTERLGRYVARFGFGHPVSPDFPGESPGIVWAPEKWTESALASVSMGYQVSVTALQMLTAVSSVANGGELVEPRVVRAVYRDSRRYAVQPRVVRRTITPDTAAALTSIMEGVVSNPHGTATRAQIPGYTIAGKTGTAAKLVNGHYSTVDYNASFVGFVPSRNPAIAIIVVTDSPHVYPNTGGFVSAPVFKRIAEATLRYMGVPPSIDPAPPVLIAPVETAQVAATESQPPEPVVSLVTDQGPAAVPDLRGMSARDAIRRIVKIGMTPRMAGDGFVVSQDPQPGAPIEPGSPCRLVLKRAKPTMENAGAP